MWTHFRLILNPYFVFTLIENESIMSPIWVHYGSIYWKKVFMASFWAHSSLILDSFFSFKLIKKRSWHWVHFESILRPFNVNEGFVASFWAHFGPCSFSIVSLFLRKFKCPLNLTKLTDNTDFRLNLCFIFLILKMSPTWVQTESKTSPKWAQAFCKNVYFCHFKAFCGLILDSKWWKIFCELILDSFWTHILKFF